MALQPGQQIPHFTVTERDGTPFDYSVVWQRRNLLLLLLPAGGHADPWTRYGDDLAGRSEALAASDTTCVVTSEAVAGTPAPAVIIVDRWGEIRLVASGATVSELPSAAQVLESVESLAHECPECEGEAR